MSLHRQQLFGYSFIAPLLLVIVTFLLYFDSLNYPLVFDSISLFETVQLNSQYSHIFGRGIIAFIEYAITSPRSLTSIIVTLINHFFGNEILIYRFFCLTLHSINTILLFKIFSSFGKMEDQKQLWPTFLSSLIFAVHPAAMYAVAYTAQISILLGTFFSLLLILQMIRFGEKPTTKTLIFILAYYALAMASKEHVIMVPVACIPLLLHQRTRIKENSKYITLLLFGLFIIATHYILLHKGFFGTAYEPWSGRMQLMNNPNGLENSIPLPLQQDHTFIKSILNQMYLFGRYSFTWILPFPQLLAIDIPLKFPRTLVQTETVMGVIIYFGYVLSAIGLYLRQKIKLSVFFALIFPWVCFWTEFSVIRFHESYVLYRSYLWMPFLIFAVTNLLLHSRTFKNSIKAFISIMIFILLLVISRVQLVSFDSHINIWKDAVKKINMNDKDNISAYRAFLFLGGLQTLSGDVETGIQNILISTEFNPNSHLSFYNLGLSYTRLNQNDNAIKAFEKASELAPEDTQTFYNLANAHLNNKNTAKAIELFNEALRLNPNHADAHHNLAIALFQSEQYDAAISHYLSCMKLEPNHPKVDYNYANVLMVVGKTDTAITHYNKALAHDPNSKFGRYNLALAYMKNNQLKDATYHLKILLKLHPDFELAQNLLTKISLHINSNITP